MMKMWSALVGAVAVFHFCILCGRSEPADDCTVTDTIERFGGTIEDRKILISKPDGNVEEVIDGKTVVLLNSTIVDADFGILAVALEKIADLKKLDLRSTKITGEGLGAFGALSALIELDLSGTLVTDATLGALCNYPRLQKVSANYTRVTPEGLGQLYRLESLTNLELAGAKLTKDRLNPLTKFRRVEELNLSAIAMTEADFAILENWAADLRILNAATTGATDDALRHVAKLANLQWLELSGNKDVTDAGILKLKEFTRLTMIGLAGVGRSNKVKGKLTNDSLTGLLGSKMKLTHLDVSDTATIFDSTVVEAAGDKITSIRWIKLNQTGMSDCEMEAVGKMVGLESLNLSATAVTDDGLEDLRGLVQLSDINIENAKTTEGGVNRLRALRAKYARGLQKSFQKMSPSLLDVPIPDVSMPHLEQSRKNRSLPAIH